MQNFRLVGTPKSIFSSTILEAVTQNINDSKSITIVTSYLTEDGWNQIHDDIAAAIKRKCVVRLFSDARDINTDYSLLDRLDKEFNKKRRNFYGMVFENDDINMLHAKFFVFDKDRNNSTIIVGSANVTYPRFFSNLETGLMCDIKTTDEVYRDISDVIEAIESSSHEPTKEEYSSYLRNKSEIERARAHLLLKSK